MKHFPPTTSFNLQGHATKGYSVKSVLKTEYISPIQFLSVGCVNKPGGKKEPEGGIAQPTVLSMAF